MPLSGLQVVEIAQGLSGPFCSQYLAEAGADVIKVEPLQGDRSRGWGPPFVNEDAAAFVAVNRGKRSIALDVNTPEGRDALHRLVRLADIVVEDLGPGEAEALGIGYAELRTANQDVIYCSMRDFSEEGPFKDLPGSELIFQAMAEYTASLGTIGEPPVRVGADVAEMTAAMLAFLAILGAAYRRNRTGRGDKVRVDKAGALPAIRRLIWSAQSDPDGWLGLHCDNAVWPREHGVRTKDRPIYFILRKGDDSLFDQLAIRLGIIDQTAGDERFAGGGRHAVGVGTYAQEVKHIWEEAFKDMTAEEALEIIREYGGDGAPWMDYPSLMEHPQTKAMEIIGEEEYPGHGKMRYVKPPWRIENAPEHALRRAPKLGEHTDEVLGLLGYTAEEIKALREKRAVR